MKGLSGLNVLLSTATNKRVQHPSTWFKERSMCPSRHVFDEFCFLRNTDKRSSIVCENLTMRADLKCVPVEIKMPPARLWIGRGGYKVGRERLGVAVKRFLLKEPRKGMGVEALGKNFGVERGQYWAVTPFKEKIVIYKQYHYSVKSS